VAHIDLGTVWIFNALGEPSTGWSRAREEND
jgi:hypothetical protein